MRNNERVYTVREAATIIGVSGGLVRMWLNEGKLRGYRIDPGNPQSEWRVYASSVEAHLKKQGRQNSI